jgi:hypothetical protein
VKFTFRVDPDQLNGAVKVAKNFLACGEVRPRQRDCVVYTTDDPTTGVAFAVWGDRDHVRVYSSLRDEPCVPGRTGSQLGHSIGGAGEKPGKIND